MQMIWSVIILVVVVHGVGEYHNTCITHLAIRPGIHTQILCPIFLVFKQTFI